MCNHDVDFKAIADDVLDRTELVEALEKCYLKGYQHGFEEGYEGVWWKTIDEDKDYQEAQGNT